MSLVDYEALVRSFHRKYGHLIQYSPNVHVLKEVKELRMKLIQEECDQELLPALDSYDISEIADGAADLIYVVVGTCISYGIPINRIFREVHYSNMTKTPVKAENGQKYGTKTPKGPDYIPPDIKGILEHPELKTKLEEKYDSV
jgi:predicted HAD superfamily Cof-like phosphohydrolase